MWDAALACCAFGIIISQAVLAKFDRFTSVFWPCALYHECFPLVVKCALSSSFGGGCTSLLHGG